MSCAPADLASFREDAPRPPVPGQEGREPCRRATMGRKRRDVRPAGGRRDQDGLGEPEGSASPQSPLGRWSKSLPVLLRDRDGAQLFRTFLERENWVDLLDFWFACNGFRQMDVRDGKTARVAKAIHKRYIESGVVAEQLPPATRARVRDRVWTQRVDSRMFDQAQGEVQKRMEEHAYRSFLTSDLYAEFARVGCESPAYGSPVPLACEDLSVGTEGPERTRWERRREGECVALRTGPAEHGYPHTHRSHRHTDAHLCRANTADAVALVASANDSEVSSDTLTDDSVSVTESSADSVPPYRHQLSRRTNARPSLPHFPRTQRLPRDVTPVEPTAFAAQLIARLERLRSGQERSNTSVDQWSRGKLEEKDETLPCPFPEAVVEEEDPQAILDQHLSRVLLTPGCQSPSPSPAHLHQPCPRVDNACGCIPFLPKRPCEVAEGMAQATLPTPPPPTMGRERCRSVWQWMVESEQQERHSALISHTHSWGGGGIGAAGLSRPLQPAHPFVQDPAMPPLSPPNTLSQLEEACRRLEEASKPPSRARYAPTGLQREKSSHRNPLLPNPLPPTEESTEWHQAPCCPQELVVTYFFCGEEIPYRRMMTAHNLTLGHFKEQLCKKGTYRFYFKKASEEFECGAVFEEVRDDSALLPVYEGKVLGKVERTD